MGTILSFAGRNWISRWL